MADLQIHLMDRTLGLVANDGHLDVSLRAEVRELLGEEVEQGLEMSLDDRLFLRRRLFQVLVDRLQLRLYGFKDGRCSAFCCE